MPHAASCACSPNHGVAAFYDRVHKLYPFVECFCSPGRRRLIRQINREPPGRLLEVGVGPGSHLRLYEGHYITAVDCSARMVARSRSCSPTTTVRQLDGEELDFAPASFDYVVFFHVLAVTADPARMLAEAERVLRQGGRLFVLNHETPKNAWRYIDNVISPLARRLHFRSRFRLEEIAGIECFRVRWRTPAGLFGLMTAYSFEK